MKQLITFIILLMISWYCLEDVKKDGHVDNIGMDRQEISFLNRKFTKLKNKNPYLGIHYIIRNFKILVDKLKKINSRVVFIIALKRIKMCCSIAGAETHSY